VRPVNLIPPEDQRGDRAPMRAGIISYVFIGVLAVSLLLVIATALTSKSISDKETEKQSLQAALQEATAKAESLRPFADFRAMQESRTATVASLAQSRFDWERVLRELALVIPEDVWVVNLTGTVTPAVSVEGAAEVSIRDSIEGPALEIVGCAADQDAVAVFIAALEDIDGVTRVGMASSERPEGEAAAAVPSGGEQTNDECRTRDEIPKFELVAAFDAVPVPATASASPVVPAPLAQPGGEAVPASSTAPPTASNSAQAQTAKAKNATELVPGAGG